MDKILDNGFCVKHGLHFTACHECFNKWQLDQNARWLHKHNELVKAGQFLKMCNENTITAGRELFH